jgi:uncharacterized membrane protein YgaE (UPF0421/DUF939 family)
LTIGGPLAFIAPLLAVSIVSGSDRPPSLKAGGGMLLVTAAGMLAGLLFSKLFLYQPPLACLILTVVFFWIYYLNNLGRLHAFVSTMLLLGMTVMPMMALIEARLASVVAWGLVVAAAWAMVFSNICYWLFPHRESNAQETASSAAFADAGECARRAAISTLVVVPAMIVFLAFELSSGTLIIAFIALLSLNPALENARKAGMGLLLGNLLGGAVALAFFHWMNVSPHLSVYLATIALFSLSVSRQIYSGRKTAVFWSMALSTMLLLTGSIMSGSGGDIDAKLVSRILQILVVAAYMMFAIGSISEFLRARYAEQKAAG